MKTRSLVLLLCSVLFVFGQQTIVKSAVLINKNIEESVKEAVLLTNEINNDQEIHFYLKESVNDDHKKLYYRIGEKGKEELLFDPHQYEDDKGDVLLIKSFSPNKKGTKVCLALGPKEAKKATLFIVDVQTKKLHKEQIDNCMNHKVSWMEDGKSFMYCRKYFDVNRSGKLFGDIFLHKVGMDPSEDKMISFSKYLPEYY
jgi:prolyl oligopeptidase